MSAGAGVEHKWWRHVTARLDEMREAGFTALWLPPCSKAASATSMGYDPFDFFDLGEFDQRGGMETWFGNKADLVALVEAAHARGMQVYADTVYNHMSGGEQEWNPDFRPRGLDALRPPAGASSSTTPAFTPAGSSASTTSPRAAWPISATATRSCTPRSWRTPTC